MAAHIDDTPSVLLVDDRPENLLALEAVLEPLHVRLRTAESGEEALKALLEEDFAVMLLDVQMPGMDGFETAKYIRGRGVRVAASFSTSVRSCSNHESSTCLMASRRKPSAFVSSRMRTACFTV